MTYLCSYCCSLNHGKNGIPKLYGQHYVMESWTKELAYYKYCKYICTCIVFNQMYNCLVVGSREDGGGRS